MAVVRSFFRIHESRFIRHDVGRTRNWCVFTLLIALALVAPSVAPAQQGRSEVIKAAAVAGAAGDKDHQEKLLQAYDQISTQATIRSLSILVFALIVIGSAIWLRRSRLVTQIIAFKMICLTLVLTAGLILVVAGFSNEQITSMMGLLGTVAGYLLGKNDEHQDALHPEEPESKSAHGDKSPVPVKVESVPAAGLPRD